MSKKLQNVVLGLYLIILVPLNLLGHYLGESWMVVYSKPLLMPCLMVFFSLVHFKMPNALKYGVLGALFFSWIGDVALMFESENSLLFMVGLGGFLVAHVHYIFVFIKASVKSKGNRKQVWFVIPVFVIYTVGLISLLWNHLGELQIPVLIYALVLMMMGVTAVSRKGKEGFYWVLFGAVLFVISDSVLAINKFYAPFDGAREITMLTYTMAQLLIVLGLSKFIQKEYE